MKNRYFKSDSNSDQAQGPHRFIRKHWRGETERQQEERPQTTLLSAPLSVRQDAWCGAVYGLFRWRSLRSALATADQEADEARHPITACAGMAGEVQRTIMLRMLFLRGVRAVCLLCPALFGVVSYGILGADTPNIMENPATRAHNVPKCSGANGPIMPQGSTAFSSLEAQPRSKEGINGSLTPARRQRRLSFHTNPLSSQKTTNDEKSDDVAAYAGTGDQNPLPERKGSREYGRLASSGDRLEARGEGISLQETQARIQELERSEFDLKMRLFYAEEQLANAAGRADAVQLHREIADAKRRRAHAEDRTRVAGEALSALEVDCRKLQAQVRDMEVRRKKDQETRAEVEDSATVRLKKHIMLLEDALRAERVENARLRVAATGCPGSDDDLSAGAGLRRSRIRRRSTGDDGVGHPNPWSSARGNGGGSFEPKQREQERLLVAKVGAQDSSMRLLRADVTTLRKRLRTQGEVLSKQRQENEVVRQAAEQVACVEAEEISRLTAALKQAVAAASQEAVKRRAAEKRLAALDTRLIALKTNGTRTPRSTSRTPSPHSNTRSNDGSTIDTGWAAHRKPWSPGMGASSRSSAWEGSGSRETNRGRETRSLPPPRRGATGSTVASRGRRLARDSTGVRWEGGRVCGKRRSSSSRRGSRGSEKEHWRPPGCSPPPSPVRRVAGRGARVSGGAVAATASGRHRPRGRGRPGEGGPAPGLKSSSLGFSNESANADASGCGGGGGGGRGREGVSCLNKGRLRTSETCASPLRNGEGPSGRPSVGRRKREDCKGGVDGDLGSFCRPRGNDGSGGCGTAGAGRLSRNSVASRASTSTAVTVEEGVNNNVAVGGTNSELPRNSRSGVSLKGKGDGANGACVVSTPADDAWSADGVWSGGMLEVGAIAAAIRGVDLSETVARELRLAVATTAAPAAAPPALRATRGARRGFAEDNARKNTQAYGASGEGDKAAPLSDCGDERRNGALESWETREARRRHRRGGSEYTSGGFKLNGRVLGGSPGDGGRALKSREVVELESDVQHIFQFFEARDRAGKAGGERSGLTGGGQSAEGGDEDFISAIAGALA